MTTDAENWVFCSINRIEMKCMCRSLFLFFSFVDKLFWCECNRLSLAPQWMSQYLFKYSYVLPSIIDKTIIDQMPYYLILSRNKSTFKNLYMMPWPSLLTHIHNQLPQEDRTHEEKKKTKITENIKKNKVKKKLNLYTDRQLIIKRSEPVENETINRMLISFWNLNLFPNCDVVHRKNFSKKETKHQ